MKKPIILILIISLAFLSLTYISSAEEISPKKSIERFNPFTPLQNFFLLVKTQIKNLRDKTQETILFTKKTIIESFNSAKEEIKNKINDSIDRKKTEFKKNLSDIIQSFKKRIEDFIKDFIKNIFSSYNEKDNKKFSQNIQILI